MSRLSVQEDKNKTNMIKKKLFFMIKSILKLLKFDVETDGRESG